MKINHLKYDMLKEMFNIGVGKAAGMLSEIVHKRVLLSVPHLELQDHATEQVDSLPNALPEGTLVVSSIRFQEKLAGEANLIFPAPKMRQFLNLCLGEEPDPLTSEQVFEFNDIDLDIIKEVGNIVLNSIVGELGNLLQIDLSYSLPRVRLLGQKEFERNSCSQEYCFRMVLYISFLIHQTEINGAIIMDMTINSLQEIMNTLAKMEADLYE